MHTVSSTNDKIIMGEIDDFPKSDFHTLLELLLVVQIKNTKAIYLATPPKNR